MEEAESDNEEMMALQWREVQALSLERLIQAENLMKQL